MKLRELLRMAWRAIAAHRLRSTLTVLGIVVGVGAVVVFASFGASVQTDIVSQFQGTSASEIYVVPGGDDGPPGGAGSFVRPVFTANDVGALRDVDGVRAVIPRGIVPTSSITYGGETVGRSQVTATTPAAFDADRIVAGREFDSGAQEVVLNEAAAESLGDVAVGESLTVAFADDRAATVSVVGIVSGTRGEIGGNFGGATPRFYLPADPYYQTTVESPSVGVDQRAYPQLTVVAAADRVDTTKASVESYLQTESDAVALLPEDGGFSVQSSADIVEGIEEVISDITQLVTGIAVMSLVVGGFGIANIMLVSVTERTDEIGIMKAVGATNREVMGLFLAESATLGVVGSVVGVPLGLGVGYVAATRYADVGFTTPLDWIGIAVGMGLAVGVVAGLYPAWRAASVDPIEALRYE